MITRRHIIHRYHTVDRQIKVRSEIGYEVQFLLDERMVCDYGHGAIEHAERTNEREWHKALYRGITNELIMIRRDIRMVRNQDDIAAVCRKLDSLITETQWGE